MPSKADTSQAPDGVKMVKFKINGQEIEAPAGTSIIRAAQEHGFDVPHFCYHPGLRPDGNCRMCLVEASNSRKPVASCVTPVAEGIEVLTDSPTAREAREGVLELMLLNHPLDCPICDKSGECMLQDNVYDHGPDHSRMQEPKVLKPTKDLGSSIALWGNRCIVCTRCVRFCDDVAGTSELTIVERGDHSVVDVFPGYPLQNPLSLNTVDICPVGALISKDFLYQARVWNMKKFDSICTGCARGCNIEVQLERNQIKRLMPRVNPEVNDHWMCDYGRFEFKHALLEDRQLRYRLVSPTDGQVVSKPTEAARLLLDGVRAAIDAGGSEAVAGIASAFMTLEELLAFRTLFRTLGSSDIAALARPVLQDEEFPEFRISGDKNPNRAGVELLLGKNALGSNLESIKSGIREGRIRAAIVVDDLPHQPMDDELLELLGRLDFCGLFLIQEDPRLPDGVSLLPCSTFGEKEGTMINEDGRLQRVRLAMQLPRSVRYEHEIFQEMLVHLGERARVLSPGALFRQLGEEDLTEVKDMAPRDLGDLGKPLETLPSGRAEPSQIG